MNEGLEEHPYRQSVGDQIWERALRNHFPNPIRDYIRRNGLKWASKKYPVVYKLFIHEILQEAAQHVYERGAGHISVAAIAEVLNSGSLSIREEIVRGHLKNDFPHLKEQYGIRMRSYYEIGQDYEHAIVDLWNKHQRRPTLKEIANVLRIKSGSDISQFLGRYPLLKRLWENGPKLKDKSDTEG